MAVFAIGDLHLSLSAKKPMDVFRGWENYLQRLTDHWQALVQPQDTVVLAGDISWGMSLEEALEDFLFLQRLPGRKVLIKGNHDYWWTTVKKMESFFAANGLDSLSILHNNCVAADGLVLCGTRGWIFEKGVPQDQKVAAREAQRLQTSLQAAQNYPGEKVVFLHYPPLYCGERAQSMLDLLAQFGITRCYYGHIHAAGCQHAFNGLYEGTRFQLISADYLQFRPVRIIS